MLPLFQQIQSKRTKKDKERKSRSLLVYTFFSCKRVCRFVAIFVVICRFELEMIGLFLWPRESA
jgi:hypothetical protein